MNRRNKQLIEWQEKEASLSYIQNEKGLTHSRRKKTKKKQTKFIDEDINVTRQRHFKKFPSGNGNINPVTSYV